MPESTGSEATIVYVLTDNEPHEGGAVRGVYSTLEAARKAMATYIYTGFDYRAIVPVEVDSVPNYWDVLETDRNGSF